MIKINSSWSFFKISEIFKIIKGRNVSVSDFVEDKNGDIKFLSAKSINNGVIFQVNSKCVDSNKIHNFSNYFLTITTNGECGVVFIHKGKIIKTSDVYILNPKNELSKQKLIFLKVILEKEKYRYSWGRKNKGDYIKNTLIKLPSITVNNKIVPDWEFMENYVNELENQEKKLEYLALAKVNQKYSLDTNSWSEFKLADLISFITVEPINKNKIEDNFVEHKKTPYFTRTSENNGIENFYNLEPTQPKNTISIGSVANKMFFQPYKFALGPYTLNFKLGSNKYATLFFITVCNFNFKIKYSFSRSITKTTLIKETIKLPSITINNKVTPDWQFMENYIKSLPFSKIL